MRGRHLMVVGAVAALALMAAPQDGSAQQAGGWWEWALPEVADLRGGNQPIIALPRGDQRSRGKARGGPPFCRNGQGHPVHGRQWCRDKGFGLGTLDRRWDMRGWEDVVLRTPRRNDRRGTLGRGGLIDILGDVVLGRLASEGARHGTTGPLTGRWLQTDGAAVLQIRAGSVPLAELTDLNGDGRVDAVLIARR